MVAEKPDVMPRWRDCRTNPGVYLFKDRFKSRSSMLQGRDLQKRVSQYSIPRPAPRRSKTQALLDAWDLEVTQ